MGSSPAPENCNSPPCQVPPCTCAFQVQWLAQNFDCERIRDIPAVPLRETVAEAATGDASRTSGAIPPKVGRCWCLQLAVQAKEREASQKVKPGVALVAESRRKDQLRTCSGSPPDSLLGERARPFRPELPDRCCRVFVGRTAPGRKTTSRTLSCCPSPSSDS